MKLHHLLKTVWQGLTRFEKSFLIFIITFTLLCFIARSCYPEEIDDALISAIICIESGWDADAVSPKGCIGLMQINPNGALEEYVSFVRLTCAFNPPCERCARQPNLYDGKTNIAIGRWYLNRLKDHYLKDHYSLENLLASYNWGIGNVKKVDYDYKRFPSSVKRYIKNVLNIYRER